MSDETVEPEVDPNMPEGMDPALWAALNAPAEHADMAEGYIRVPQEDGTEAVQAVTGDDEDLLDSLEFGGQPIMEQHPDLVGLDADGNPLDQQPS